MNTYKLFLVSQGATCSWKAVKLVGELWPVVIFDMYSQLFVEAVSVSMISCAWLAYEYEPWMLVGHVTE